VSLDINKMYNGLFFMCSAIDDQKKDNMIWFGCLADCFFAMTILALVNY